MFGKNVSDVRSALIKLVRTLNTVRDASKHLIISTLMDPTPMITEEIEKMSRDELTDKFMKSVASNDRKTDELLRNLDDTTLTLEERVLYFSLIYKRANELRTETFLLWRASGYVLANAKDEWLNEEFLKENWTKAVKIGYALYEHGREINDFGVMFSALYKTGVAQIGLDELSKAKSTLEGALIALDHARAKRRSAGLQEPEDWAESERIILMSGLFEDRVT